MSTPGLDRIWARLERFVSPPSRAAVQAALEEAYDEGREDEQELLLEEEWYY